jgi:hypothetical protein
LEGVSLFGVTRRIVGGCAKKTVIVICRDELGLVFYIVGMNHLPQTGTAPLLERLSPYLDDAWINALLPPQSGPGRRRNFSSAQLLRVLLLSLLTPVHSFNLLLKLLPENRAWRKFAHLPNQRMVPAPKMLHQFRSRLDLISLRRINAHLLQPLLNQLDPSRKTLAIIDSTDLAAANSFKKVIFRSPPSGRPSAFAPPSLA